MPASVPRAELTRAVDVAAALRSPGSLRVAPPTSADQRAGELDDVRRLVATRDGAQRAWIEHLDARGATSMWWGAARETRAEQGLLRGLQHRAAIAVTLLTAPIVQRLPGTGRVDLPRPFELDPTIEVVGKAPSSSSYPSGHTTLATAQARVAAHFHPRGAERWNEAAVQVGHSRLLAGVHLPSDIAAGARLGVGIGDAVVAATRLLGVR